NVPTESEDFFHQAGTDERVCLIGHHEHGFDIRAKAAIHESHLQLVFVIRDGANTAEENLGRVPGGIIHQEPFERIDLDIGIDLDDFAEHFGALLDGEERFLGLVSQYGNDKPVKHSRAALDQIEVTVGNRVERSRIDS